MPLVGRLFHYEESKYQEPYCECKFYVEEEAPRVSACKHIASIQRAGGAKAKTNLNKISLSRRSRNQQNTCIIADALASLMEEEDVVDELHRQCLAHAGTKSMNNAGGHETPECSGLRCPDQASCKLDTGIN
jgi:hypothetical protein